MPKLVAENIPLFLIQLIVLIGFSKIGGEFARKLKQPAVIGELVAGLLLGPTVLGMISPETFSWLFLNTGDAGIALDSVVFLSSLFLLFYVGLEIEVDTIAKQGKSVAWLSLFGILIPLVMGAGAGWMLYPYLGLTITREIFALFLGAAMSISALPVIARILIDLNIFKTKIGSLIVAVATVNDVVGWLLFTVALSVSGVAGHGSHPLWVTIAATLALSILSVTVLRTIMNKLLDGVAHILPGHGGVFGVTLMMMFTFSLLTEIIGIHAVFGAFLLGIAVNGSPRFAKEMRESVHMFTSHWLAPVFFAAVGLKVNFFLSFDLFVVAAVLVVAYITKLLAGIIGGKLSGLTSKESFAIGLGIAARGGMGIILATISLDSGLINEVTFEALVIMAIVTSMTAGFIKPLLGSVSLTPSAAAGRPSDLLD